MSLPRSAPLVVALSLVVSAWAAADEPDGLVVRRLPQTVFAESKLEVDIVLPESTTAATRIHWSLATTQHRTLARNEVRPTAGKTSATVTLEFPRVDEGVVLPLIFQAAIDGSRSGVRRKLWVFPQAAWAEKQTLLKQTRITLFDPDETTGRILSDADIPFEATVNVAALTELRDSTILVAEGVDFREYPDLFDALLKAAAAGNQVVCLSPAGGSLTIPDEPDVLPSGLSLRRHDVLTECDPRFDPGLWTGEDRLPVRCLAFRGEASSPSLEVSDTAAGWPWLEVRYGPGPGKLTVCGFGLLAGWEATPTPRYLLVHLLTHAAPSQASSPER